MATLRTGLNSQLEHAERRSVAIIPSTHDLMNTTSYHKHDLRLINVQFKVPVEVIDRASRTKSTSAGYFVEVGISIPPDESVRRAIVLLMTDGEIVWSDSTIDEITWDELDDELRTYSKGKERVWFHGSEFIIRPWKMKGRYNYPSG